MKIAIDLRPLQIGHQNRGIGAYLLNLLQRLPDRPDVEYIFLRYNTSNPIEDFGLKVSSKYQEVVFTKHSFSKDPLQLLAYIVSALLPSYNMVLKYHPDVFFQSDYLLGAPSSRKCQIVTVAYDLIPFRFPEMYLPSWRKFYHFKQHKLKSRARLMLRAWFYQRKYKAGTALLRKSNKIISISQNTKQDITSLVGVPADKISVIYPAPSFRDGKEDKIIDPETKRRIDAIKEPFITYVGGTDARRQIDELVMGFNLYNARERPLSLVLCGNEFADRSIEINAQAQKAIETSSYGSRIYRFGRITEAEKRYILTKSLAFVYPTLYEGFGLPIVEAFSCGTPVITYKNSSIPEIAEEAALYCSVTGGYAIFEAIKELSTHREKWLSAAKKGKLKAATFSWDQCATDTWNTVLQSAPKE